MGEHQLAQIRHRLHKAVTSRVYDSETHWNEQYITDVAPLIVALDEAHHLLYVMAHDSEAYERGRRDERAAIPQDIADASRQVPPHQHAFEVRLLERIRQWEQPARVSCHPKRPAPTR